MAQNQQYPEELAQAFAEKRMNRRDLIKRLGLLGFSATAIGSFLTACGANQAPSPGGGESGGAASSTGSGTATEEFTTFYTGADGHIMQDIVDRYNQSHDGPDFKLSAPAWGADYVTKLQTAALAGTPPAVVALHNYEIPPLAKFLYEIDPAALGLDKQNFVDIAWRLPMYKGKLLGLTMSTGTLGLFYNKDHFEQARLDPEKPPTNRDEFIEAAIALTRDGRYGFVRDSGGWMPWLTFNWQNGGDLLSEDGKQALFNTPAAIEAAQLEQDLIQKHKAALPELAEDLQDLLYAGKVSMAFLGPWNLNKVIENNQKNGTNFGWTKMPAFFDKKKAVMSTSHIYSLMKPQTEEPEILEAGGKFISWLLAEGSLSWAQAQAPTNKQVLEQMRASDNPAVQGMTMWVEQAEHAHFPPYHPRWGEVYRGLSEAMQRVVFQGNDVKSTLDQVTAQANEILARE